MKDKILVEKYRPKNLNEFVSLPEGMENMINENISHLLLTGSPGTGKTSLALIIIKKLQAEHLILNGSDERGIETIRQKVKTFAMTKSVNNNIKIIFLDEADHLTKDAQTSLRNIFETYSSNCRFILSGNYSNRFIPALKSRCIEIVFKQPNKEKLNERLDEICKEEDIHISGDLTRKLIDKFYPDIRKMINTLQELSNLKRTITSVDIKKEEMFVEQIFARLKQKKIVEARQILLDNNVDYSALTLDCYYWVWQSDLNGNKKIKLIQILCNADKYMNVVISKELLFLSTMIDMIKVLSE